METRVTVGDTLSEVFSLYRAHAAVLLPLAFWVYLAVAIVAGIGESPALILAAIVVGGIAGALYQGAVVGLVRDAREGRDEASMGGLVETALGYVLPLLAIGVLAGIAIGVGFVLLIIPGLYLMTIWAVLAPVIVVEDSDVLAAFGRSRRLVRGNFWPVLGALFVAFAIAGIGSVVLIEVAGAIAGGPLLRIVFSAIASTVTAPITGLVAGVLYYRLLAVDR